MAHLTESLARVPYRYEVEVLLETTPAEARRRIPPTVTTLSEVDGGVLVRTRAEQLAGMAQLLAGLGCPFRINHPDELRAEVRRLGRRLLELAGEPAAPGPAGPGQPGTDRPGGR